MPNYKKYVVHYREDEYDVHIGRGDGPWGNPYRIGMDGTRAEVIEWFEKYLLESPKLLKQLPKLKGKILGCYCAPKPCHGEVLAKYANNPKLLERALNNKKKKPKKDNPFTRQI